MKKISKEKQLKTNFEAISNAGLQINTDKVADEILDWLIANVEQYIDNQVKTFKIDLVVAGDSTPPMPETRKFNDVFRHMPDDDELVNAKDVFREDGTVDMSKFDGKNVTDATKTRSALNEIAEECFLKLQSKEEKLRSLYERMIFFYEMVGFHKGGPLLREIEGAVNIIKFEYEAFSMDVQVQSPTFQIQRENGEIDMIDGETKAYTVPEGFTVWVEIAFSPKAVTNSMF